jgi:hypothetical protein
MTIKTLTSQSYLATREGVVTGYVGPDAAKCFQAIVLTNALWLYAKHRMIANRHYTPMKMLAMASRFTDITYHRGQYEEAAFHVQRWADEMKAALPKMDE